MTPECGGGNVVGLRVVICDSDALHGQCLALSLRSKGVDADCAWNLATLLGQLDNGVPDAILLDTVTPDAATLLRVSLDLGPRVRVIVTGLSQEEQPELLSYARAGVAGLHLETESLDQLLDLLRPSAPEKRVCSATISAMLRPRNSAATGQQTPESQVPLLTDRENQILAFLGEGLSNQQIAIRLNVSIHTVKNHAHSLFSKLGVGSRAEAVAAHHAPQPVSTGC